MAPDTHLRQDSAAKGRAYSEIDEQAPVQNSYFFQEGRSAEKSKITAFLTCYSFQPEPHFLPRRWRVFPRRYDSGRRTRHRGKWSYLLNELARDGGPCKRAVPKRT